MNHYLKVLAITTLVFIIQYTSIHAQVAINTDGKNPDASAMLDISSSDKGILIPRMTTAERNRLGSIAATALLVFDTDTGSFWFYNGTAWEQLISTNTNTTSNNRNGTSSVAMSVEDNDGDTKIQVEESADEDIIRFDAGGTEYMTLSNGVLSIENTGNSVFIGKNAGINDDQTNNRNVYVGIAAGKDNTTGLKNTAIGHNALSSNQTGEFNVAIGSNSLRNNTASSNVAIGQRALLNNSTGSSNTGLGKDQEMPILQRR